MAERPKRIRGRPNKTRPVQWPAVARQGPDFSGPQPQRLIYFSQAAESPRRAVALAYPAADPRWADEYRFAAVEFKRERPSGAASKHPEKN
jgi:hypothetical protein